jgi:pyruvate/2-oxoglutarate dehydrogenase complex dihydrolipoamide acyltransferase (E2) component
MAGQESDGTMTAGTEPSTRWPTISKDISGFLVRPNLVDYEAACAAFSWDEARRALSGLPGGRGVNIAYEAVDRHAAGEHAGREALRFVRADGSTHSFSFAELAGQTNRFAGVLRSLGIGRGERVFSLTGRGPALYIAVLGTFKNASVFCPLFSAFGPEPVRQRLHLGSGRALVTTRVLYRKKIAQLRDSLPELQHVLLTDADGDPEPGTLDLAALMREAPADGEIAATQAEDMALLHFTSGTTGTPKGAIHVHDAVTAPATGYVPRPELGVELATIAGTGPQGAVTEADVHRAAGSHAEALVPEIPAPAPQAPPKGAPEEPVTGKPSEARERVASLRRAIGALMSRSKKTIPHYYLSTTLDLRAAVDWMQSVNAQRPVAARLVPSALLLKAAALAAREVPEVNGFYDDGGFRPSASVHLGVAVALRQGGLVAPAIHDADTLPVEVLMEQLRDLVSRARAGRLQRAEMADPTITVINLGDLGVESVYGVIYPPQVAMVGFGRVMEQPWAQNGMLGVRHAVIATLSADHRVSDGLRGGRYLARIEELLQKPEEL